MKYIDALHVYPNCKLHNKIENKYTVAFDHIFCLDIIALQIPIFLSGLKI